MNDLDLNQTISLDPVVTAAVLKIEEFITQTTGQAPTSKEMSDALTRYFVLNEILEFIKMSREEGE